MAKKYLTSLAVLIALSLSTIAQNLPGFKVVGRHLYDHCGERVILRGLSNPNIWFETSGETYYPEIKQTEANVVRIVWETWGTAEQLDVAITNCIANDMIPMPELHDATGDWSKLQDCINYWTDPEIVSVLRKHEKYLLVNIANECGDYFVSSSEFLTGYTSAVTQMRSAGIHVPLVIDGTDWGKNINILQSQGPSLIEADPDNNLLFSVHMWWPKMYGYSESDIADEIEQSVAMDLPLIVGEFSQMHGSCEETQITDQNSIAYNTIIRECEANDIGYIAWSWFGNCNSFWDMSTDGTYATLYDWGLEVAVTDTNSIQNTSVRPYSILNNECDPTSIDVPESVAESFILHQNYPNPFGVSTLISYSLGIHTHVKLTVYNSTGAEVKTLVNETQSQGTYTVNFDVDELPTGIYSYTIMSEGNIQSRKMMILR